MWLIQNPALYRVGLYQAITPIIYFAHHRQTTINHSSYRSYIYQAEKHPTLYSMKNAQLCPLFSDSFMMIYLEIYSILMISPCVFQTGGGQPTLGQQPPQLTISDEPLFLSASSVDGGKSMDFQGLIFILRDS